MATESKVLSFTRTNASPLSAAAHGLKASRTTLPQPIAGYFHRPRLLERHLPLEKRLGVVQAPCGFGKTALLTDICHRSREQGALVAWLRLGDDVTVGLLLDYLALALTRAGLDLSARRSHWLDDRHLHSTNHRLGLLMRSVEDYAKPCLLALDEVERVAAPETVAMIDYLIRCSPHNLHVAMATRTVPHGFDLSNAVLNHQCTVLTVEDLCFTSPEIALFLDRPLSREGLVRAVEKTEGWPVALGFYRDALGHPEQTGELDALPGYRSALEDFLGARLTRDLSPTACGLLLDLAVFDTFDLDRVDDIVSSEHLAARNELFGRLKGLIRPVDQARRVLRVHPAVRVFCRERLQQEDTGRFMRLHRRMAIASARSSDLAGAIRHAKAAGDDTLFGEILHAAGCGAGVVFGNGIDPFLNVVSHLDSDAVASDPRLAYLKCVALVLRGDTRAARVLLERVGTETGEGEPGRDGRAVRALRADRVIAHWLLLAFTCRSVNDPGGRRVLDEAASLAADDGLAPLLRGSLNTLRCIDEHQRGRFARSQQWGSKAKQLFASANSTHGQGLIDLQRGIVAMAQGRVKDAVAAYARHGANPVAQLMRAELQIERNRTDTRTVRASLNVSPAEFVGWLDIHAAAHANQVELAFDRGGADAALSVVEESLIVADRTEFASLLRILTAQRVSWLAAAGQVDAAQRAWDGAGLPNRLADQLDLDGQSWREMEAIACARIRLLRARREYADARRVAFGLRACASGRGLIRTLMRCLVEWMVLEFESRDTAAAAARLHEFLCRFQATDYSRSLTHIPDVGGAVLEHLLKMDLEHGVRAGAESLRHVLGKAAFGDRCEVPHYSAQEVKVLQGLTRGERDKEIARRVGLSENGVRYHLKKIYRKLGVSRRGEAVRRARSSGIV